jgi:four helix bundle protein
MPTSQGFRDLKVYRLAFRLAMEIFYDSKHFPGEEKFPLTNQIRRASRSVATNIGEGYREKRYPKLFVAKMADADGKEQKLKSGSTSLKAVDTSPKSVRRNSEWVTKKSGEC